MTVLTIEAFGQGSDYSPHSTYSGLGILFRFRVSTLYWFLGAGLPHFYKTFDIDPRSIYEIRIDGLMGHFAVQLFVSMTPSLVTDERLEKLKEPIESSSSSDCCLEWLLRELIDRGVPMDSLAKGLELVKGKSDSLGEGLLDFEAGTNKTIKGREVTVTWETGVPCEGDLIDFAFVIEEGLRCRFKEVGVSSMVFKGLPETEESYLCRARYVAPNRARLRPFCTSPRRAEREGIAQIAMDRNDEACPDKLEHLCESDGGNSGSTPPVERPDASAVSFQALLALASFEEEKDPPLIENWLDLSLSHKLEFWHRCMRPLCKASGRRFLPSCLTIQLGGTVTVFF